MVKWEQLKVKKIDRFQTAGENTFRVCLSTHQTGNTVRIWIPLPQGKRAGRQVVWTDSVYEKVNIHVALPFLIFRSLLAIKCATVVDLLTITYLLFYYSYYR